MLEETKISLSLRSWKNISWKWCWKKI